MEYGEREDVALRVAPAEALGKAARGGNLVHALGIASRLERRQRFSRRQADLARHIGIVSGVGRCMTHRLQRALGVGHTPGAQERHDRVQIIEGVERVLRGAFPGGGQSREAIADVDAFLCVVSKNAPAKTFEQVFTE